MRITLIPNKGHPANVRAARALLAAEQRGEEKAAEVLCAYPPDAFFEVLHARTHRLPDEDHNWILEGDTGNWAAHMSVLLQPYAADIRSLGDKT